MLSLNARVLPSLEKRKSLLIWLQKQNADIIFIQETYSTKDLENMWKWQWKGSTYFAHGSNRSCGVLILVKACLEFDLKSILAVDNGRFILMNATVQGWNYFLATFMRRTKYANTSPRMLLSFAVGLF